MATYSTVKGFEIQSLGTDPNLTQAAAGSWATGGNLNTARTGMGGSGTQTAGLVYGGWTTTWSALVESYNGSAWTETTDINTGRYEGGCFGLQTAAVLASGKGGSPVAVRTQVEAYDGTSWSETTDV